MEPNINIEDTLGRLIESRGRSLTSLGANVSFTQHDSIGQRSTLMTAGSKLSWEHVLGSAWEKRGPATVRHRIQRVYGTTVSWEEAEDIFQTALMRAFEKKALTATPTKSPDESQRILFGFVKNVIREWWRNEALRRNRLKLETLDDDRDAPTISPDMVERFVRSAWEGLDEQERVIFNLHYLEGKTQTEIMDKLKISLGTVHNRLKKIRARFYETRERICEEDKWLNIK